MVVQHNMQAMNANRMLNVTTGSQAKSTEKLSSGYKINRAADDAAGLSISEKMRKQIRGLDQASSNAQDGVSAVQTAEGALTEVHSMLQRMNELAVQAANGTNSESDRKSIQDEIDQLTTEIDRVAETTKFNETYLLKGNVEGTTSNVKVAAHDAGLAGKLTDNEDGTFTFKTNALSVGDKVTIAGKEYSIVDSDNPNDYVDITKSLVKNASAAAAKDTEIIKDGKKYIIDTAATTSADAIVKDEDGNTVSVSSLNGGTMDGKKIYGDPTDTDGFAATAITGAGAQDVDDKIKALEVGDKAVFKNKDGITMTYTIGTSSGDESINASAKTGTQTVTADDLISKLEAGSLVTITAASAHTTEGVTADAKNKLYIVGEADDDESTITLQDAYDKMAKELQAASSIGTDNAAAVKNNNDGTFTITQGDVKVANKLTFNLHVGADADMTNKINVDIDAMSAAGLGVKGINVKDDSGKAATYAIDAIADAVAKVSAQRSALGAVQNRLEHTIANVDNVVENSTAAESRIRDTDMAEEMVNYSKNNILAQAGQSMLAQANQSNQGVLSLLG